MGRKASISMSVGLCLFYLPSSGAGAEPHLKRYKATAQDRLLRMQKFFATHLGLDSAASSPQ